MKSVFKPGRLAALALATVLLAAAPGLPAYAETASQTPSASAGSKVGAPDAPYYGYGPGGYGMGPGPMYGYGRYGMGPGAMGFYGMGPGMMYGYGGYGGGSGMLFGGVLWMILAWGIPLLLLFLLARYVFGRMGNGGVHKDPPPRSALDILKESYARGEIERDEYLRKRDDLLEK